MLNTTIVPSLNRKKFITNGHLLQFVIGLFLLCNSAISYGQLQIYTDRAAWEAALSNVVTEDLESVTEDFYLANSFESLPTATITVGTHTFTGNMASPAGPILLDTPPLDGASLMPNTTQISWWGTTGAVPQTIVSIPTAFGIGFDWKSSAPSYGLHNSIYLQVYGNSGSINMLLNPFTNAAAGEGITEGFIGVISPCGGISSYTVYSYWTNWQNFSIDNFAYGSITPLPDSDNDGTADCYDECPNDPLKVVPGACGCGIVDVDNDNDGSYACEDCDDHNPLINPAIPENLTNGIDDNCDGLIDIPAYCKPVVYTPCAYMWITNVTLDDINHSSACTSGGHSLTPSPTATLEPGANHTVYVSGGGSYDQKVSVFIDWNTDGDFYGPNEKVANDLYLPQSGVPASATFTVPASQSGGTYLMRVVSDYQYYSPDPCFSQYGEVEDYFVTIDGCDDLDGDGHEDATCGGDDCADNDSTVYPGALDTCDGKDNDCDGMVDEGGSGTTTGWSEGNIGGATNTGSSFSCNSGSPAGTVFSVNSQGFSSVANADLMYSNYIQRCGDVTITAHITGNPAPGWAGIFIRESLATGSKMATLKTNLSSFLRREARTSTNANKVTTQNPLYAANTWVRIVRTGNTFAFYTSPNGTTWTFFGSSTITMSSCVYVGLFAESINAATTVTASFDNVEITGGTAPLAAMPNLEFEAQEPTPTPALYPNPTTGKISLDLTPYVGKQVSLELYTLQGKLLQTTKTDVVPGVIHLDLSAYRSGAYFVKIKSPGLPDVTKRLALIGN